MIKICKMYIVQRHGFSHSCTDISIVRKSSILCFAVDSMQENYLCRVSIQTFVR
jgi:hypothetical protein